MSRHLAQIVMCSQICIKEQASDWLSFSFRLIGLLMSKMSHENVAISITVGLEKSGHSKLTINDKKKTVCMKTNVYLLPVEL